MTSDLVRRARPGDAQTCARIVRTWLDATGWLPQGPTEDQLVDVIAAGIPIRDFWVAGDPVAGYLSLNRETAQVMGLYTEQPGAGIGKALLDRAKDGHDYLQLRSHTPNTAAHHFYEREGFVTVERDLNDGADGVPEIRMEWRR